ncbi:MAG: PAS domain S-box protein [Desulfomonilaceae bacterium]|jgi:PAS domain S-box-containing protein
MQNQDNPQGQLVDEFKEIPDEFSTHEAVDTGVNDIAGCNQAMDSLRKIQDNYRELVEYTNSVILRWDREGKITFLNKFGQDFFGYNAEEILGRNVVDTIVPETDHAGKNLQEMIQDIFIHPDLYEKNQNENIRHNGERVWISWTNKPIFDENGKVAEILSIGNDHTKLKRAEEELRKSKEELEIRVAERTAKLKGSEEKYRLLFDSAPIGIALVNLDGSILEVNRSVLEILGSPGADARNEINVITFPPFAETAISGLFKTCMAENRQIDTNIFYRTKWGKEICMRAILTPKLSEQGKVEGCLAVMEDVMPRKLAEQALRDSEEKYRTVLKSSPDPIVVYDQGGGVIYVNPAFEKTFGWSEEELIGKRIDYVPEEEKPKTIETLKLLYQGKVVPSFETRRITKDGRCLDINISAALLRDDAGKPAGNVVTLRDITQDKSLRAQLLQAQKMKAVGTLAGGIAHDFNNLLQIVLGYSEALLQRKKEGEKDYSEIHKILEAGKRGTDLVKNLLTFSRKVEPVYQPVNLNSEVFQIQQLMSRAIPKTIKIDLHLTGDLELVQADRSQLGQILMNLGVNAMDAMPYGGTLTFGTSNAILDENYCCDHIGLKPGRHVLLTVSDTGVGMEAETVAHIFEPFFTTKGVTKGTGLGLATVYGIVKKHDGHILCSSEPGNGTTFKIYFPVNETRKDSSPAIDDLAIPGGMETILVVEDDEVIRELCESTLKSFGYEVILAGDGKEALEIYEREGKRISLIVLDLIMPEMDGKRCLTEILRVNPEARVLIASGHSMNGEVRELLESGAKGFLGKPYDMGQFLTTVREVIDNG